MKYLTLIALTLLVACTGIRRDTQPPEVRLQQLTLAGATLFEQRWQVTLRVQNPNDHKLSVRALEYQLLLDEQTFARGQSAAAFVLPARGETLVTTELRTSLLQDLNRVSGLLGRAEGSLPYRIEGKAVLGTLPVPVGFSWQGRWPEPATP